MRVETGDPQGSRIVCIAQVFNELRKGNLERFLRHITPLVDEVVVYDDGSTDGTFEYLRDTDVHLIRGAHNRFADELAHKQELLDRALELAPDYILWLDADEVLTTEDPEDLQRLCALCADQDIDGVELHEVNLWRSHSWRRLDSSYDAGWFVRLWRVMPGMRYETTQEGLHQPQFPSSVQKLSRSYDVRVLHYGFANTLNLAHKYLTYRSHGQRGYAMLDRLISEERLRLEEVPAKEFPVDLRQADPRPDPLEFAQSLAYVERHRREVFRPGFSIVCLVYKSAEWARFVYEQVLRYTDMSDKEFFFVANDASDEVLAFLRANYIPHVEWNNSEAQRSEWYVNNVYRAYNFGAHQARGDLLVFINTDMAFSPGWFEALWEGYDGASAVASRLVESGKLRTGEHGIEKDFGTTPADYREQDFVEFAQDIRELTVVEGGLYMPLMVRRDTFLSVGGYPEGNPQPGGDIFNPRMASQGEPCISGDNVMIQRLASRGVRHRTACDSVAYHFQMGEKDTAGGAHNTDGPLVAICNDLVAGTMGERVLWDFLLEGLPSTIGIDSRVVGTDGRYASLAHAYINEQCPGVEVIIQNATFIDAVDPARFTIAFLQDDLRAMGRDSSQQEKNLRVARATVTNSLLAAMSYPECEFTIIPVGVDSDLFRPMDKLACRALYGLSQERVGIFVGAFDDVKGWPAVRQCIQTFPEIIWLLVTKKDESFEAANARTFCRVPQDRLVTLLNSADFFILGSPVETQCLAAIEACLCDVPVVMRSTGIFNELSNDERRQAGVFGEDLIAGVGAVAGGTFSPRDLVVRQGWTVNDSLAKWRVLLEHAMQEATSERVGFVGQTTVNEQGELAYKERCEWRPNYVPAPAGQSTAAASLSEEAAGSVEEAAGIHLELQAQKLRRNVERLVGARPAGLVLSLIHSVSWTIRPLRHRLARRRHRVR